MAEILHAYDVTNTVITSTGLDSLADGGVFVCTEIDNTTTKNLSVDVNVNLTATAGTGTIDVYVMRSNTSENYGSTGAGAASMGDADSTISPVLKSITRPTTGASPLRSVSPLPRSIIAITH